MKVTYWGVRGSIPAPGPRTVHFGGNTSCVGIEQGERLLVLDAGTGIRLLGASLGAGIREVFVLLSHRHADHIQGLPFFAPLYEPGPTVHLLDHPGPDGDWSWLRVFDGVHFPLRPDRLAETVRRVDGDGIAYLAEHGFEVRRLALNHPGGAFGYRVTDGGSSFVHLTDSELGMPTEDHGFFDRCVEFCRGAEVLSHDAQYLAEEMERWGGRGHSSVERVCDLAEAARVRHLVLFHHDPDRSDEELARVEQDASARLRPMGIGCTAAYEGLVLELGSQSVEGASG